MTYKCQNCLKFVELEVENHFIQEAYFNHLRNNINTVLNIDETYIQKQSEEILEAEKQFIKYGVFCKICENNFSKLSDSHVGDIWCRLTRCIKADMFKDIDLRERYKNQIFKKLLKIDFLKIALVQCFRSLFFKPISSSAELEWRTVLNQPILAPSILQYPVYTFLIDPETERKFLKKSNQIEDGIISIGYSARIHDFRLTNGIECGRLLITQIGPFIFIGCLDRLSKPIFCEELNSSRCYFIKILPQFLLESIFK